MTDPARRFSPKTLVIIGALGVIAGGIAFAVETGSWLAVGAIAALSIGGALVLWLLKIAGVFDDD